MRAKITRSNCGAYYLERGYTAVQQCQFVACIRKSLEHLCRRKQLTFEVSKYLNYSCQRFIFS